MKPPPNTDLSRRLFTRSLALSAGALAALPSISLAQADPNKLTGEQILYLVRMSQAGNHDLQARLRRGKQIVPLGLKIRPNTISFSFASPRETLLLEFKDKKVSLKEIKPGKQVAVPFNRFGENVRGTDVTFEDLSMRFLYWPNAVKLEEQPRIKFRKCWKLRVNNPGKDGPYAVVLLWIDQKSGGLMKVEGYDFKGRIVKRYQVISGQKLGKVWILKQMRVETVDPRTRKVAGQTYLEVKKPQK